MRRPPQRECNPVILTPTPTPANRLTAGLATGMARGGGDLRPSNALGRAIIAAVPCSRPNIVFICTDQQRYDSLGVTGNAHALTPHLDRLAGEATLCDCAIASNTICMPSRASIMTGRYPAAHGVWTNGVPLARRGYLPETSSEGGGLPPGQSAMSHLPTFVDQLAAGGYRTASIGKLHLTPTQSHPGLRFEECRQRWSDDPSMADWHGPYYGFNHVELSIGHGESIAGHCGVDRRLADPRCDDRIAAANGSPREFPGVGQLYPGGLSVEQTQTMWCADRACRWLESQAGVNGPFCLWVGFADPHHPFTPPAELAEMFAGRECMMPACGHGQWPDKPRALRRLMEPDSGWWCPPEAVARVRQYTDAMVHLIDRAVGRICDALRRQGLWDDTVLVFTSDHGDYLGDLGLLYKTSHACASLSHVPLILRVPGESGLPRRLAAPVSLTDLAPTLCELAGVAPPPGFQGESILDVARSNRRRPVVTQQFPAAADERNFAIYDEGHRLGWYPATGEVELYDLRADPCESRNVAGDASRRPLAEHLRRRLAEQTAELAIPCTGRVSIW